MDSIDNGLDLAIEIPLTQGLKAYVSPEDADLGNIAWFRAGNKRRWYAARRGDGGQLMMHRLILERMIGGPIPKGGECDHINGNALDNRRCNLRLSTRSQNNRNRQGWGKYGRGVNYDRRTNKYIAKIIIGSFDTPEEAERAWEDAALILRGEIRKE